MKITVVKNGKFHWNTDKYTAKVGKQEIGAPTAKEATDKMEAYIHQAFADSYIPTIVHYRGCIAIVYRELHGWCYAIRRQDDFCQEYKLRQLYGNNGISPSLNATLTDAKYHLAQDCYRLSDGLELPDILANTPKEKQQEFISWCQFRLDYEKQRLATSCQV